MTLLPDVMGFYMKTQCQGQESSLNIVSQEIHGVSQSNTGNYFLSCLLIRTRQLYPIAKDNPTLLVQYIEKSGYLSFCYKVLWSTMEIIHQWSQLVIDTRYCSIQDRPTRLVLFTGTRVAETTIIWLYLWPTPVWEIIMCKFSQKSFLVSVCVQVYMYVSMHAGAL